MKLLCSVLLLCLSSFLAARPVIIETSLWPGFTNADGSGAYFALAKLVLPQEQYPLVIRPNDLGRAWLAVKRGKADLTFGLTQADIRSFGLEASALAYDADTIVAVYLPDRVPRTDLTLLRLPALQLGWEKSYNYAAALGIQAEGFEVQNPAHAIQLLQAGRISVYLAESSDLIAVAKQLQAAGLQQQWLADVPVYAGFSPTAQGRQLKEQWDQRVKLLWQNGQMQAFYQRYPALQRPAPVF
ncbi:MAG: transporter substrate-binding domain-containing protein [Rheinheimera sp.]|nr:MAG: transporter substrate-binding domain-containing protein [Rheinheimera sp.]